jgi:hypothetical protein
MATRIRDRLTQWMRGVDRWLPARTRDARRHALAALLLLAIETSIALWVHDAFVRPYLGDVLVVPLVYCCVMAVYRGEPSRVLVGVFAFACAVELAQLARVVDRLHIENTALRVIIGTSFEPLDFVAYAAGALLTYLFTRRLTRGSAMLS